MIRRFNRYELKYLLDPRTYRAFVTDLRHFMVPDAHGDAEGNYRIVSLYYDSPTFTALNSKREGLMFRRKLRLRVYPTNGDVTRITVGHVEIKQRMNRTVQKRRLVLPLHQAEELCRGIEPPGELDELDSEVSSEVRYMVRAQQLRPRCIVSYRRQAFLAERFDAGMRVTFDFDLAGRFTRLGVNEPGRLRSFLPHDRILLEVKVNERIPDFMVALLAKHECQIHRFSKYCAAVEAEAQRLQFLIAHRKDEPCLT